MQALKAAGKTSADADVLVLAKEWMDLVRQFTGGGPAMAGSVARMYGNEPSMRERYGLDLDLMRFVGAAIEILRQQETSGRIQTTTAKPSSGQGAIEDVFVPGRSAAGY